MVTVVAFGYFGLASAQNAPMKLDLAAQGEQPPAPARSALAPRDAAPPAAQPRKEAGLKLQRPGSETKAPAAAGKAVDESALRFYASQGDTARVAAEIRRLKTLHAAWQPPEDLFNGSTVTIDEQPLWALFSAGRYDELREQVAVLQQEHPGYVPSADLSGKVVVAEQRQLIVSASDARDWEQVISLATENQDLLVCREIDVLWRVAEAFASTEDADRAIEVYRYILTNCDNPKERLATVQKASVALPAKSVADLIAMGKRRAGGGAEFDQVKLDLIRRSIGEVASGKGDDLPSERDLKLVEASARRGNANDAGLLGWYAYQRKEFGAARDWFVLASKASKDPKHLEGLILSTRNLGEPGEAEKLAYDGRNAGSMIRKAYIEIVATDMTGPKATKLQPDRQARIEEVVSAEQSALGSQALGWYLYNNGQFAPSRLWFERSVAWAPSEEAATGLAVAAQRLGDRKLAADTIAKYQDQYPTVAALARLQGHAPSSPGVGRKIAGRSGRGAPTGYIKETLALYEAGKYREAAAILDKYDGRMPAGMKELRGWAHLNSQDYQEAGKIFAEIQKKSPSKTAEHGQFLSEIGTKGNAHRWWYN
jgi:tetratricopeptide (TPR) repeat protein